MIYIYIIYSDVQKILVIVLIGFFGVGKIMLLNYILCEKYGCKIVVIENEFGEIGIDGGFVFELIEEIYEMMNGCVCCVGVVCEDFVWIVWMLVVWFDWFDYIIVEMSGFVDLYLVV